MGITTFDSVLTMLNMPGEFPHVLCLADFPGTVPTLSLTFANVFFHAARPAPAGYF